MWQTVDSNASRYLIPRRITQRWELAPGWGRIELLVASAGTAAAVALFLLLGLLPFVPLAARAFVALLIAGAGVIMVAPQPDGSKMLDIALAQRAYRARQRRYLYDFGRDDV